MVAESARFLCPVMAAYGAVADGRIGQILSGRVNFIGRGRRTYAYPGRRSWLADPEAGGTGIWMLNGIHAMSVARMLLGEPEEIDAREVHSAGFQSHFEATVVALLTFDSGAIAALTVSAELHGYKRFGDLVLFGTEGTLQVDWRKGPELLLFEGDKEQTIECAPDNIGGVPGQFVRQMQEFVDAVAEGREPSPSGPG
jgi:predicted dehydrogenase